MEHGATPAGRGSMRLFLPLSSLSVVITWIGVANKYNTSSELIQVTKAG